MQPIVGMTATGVSNPRRRQREALVVPSIFLRDQGVRDTLGPKYKVQTSPKSATWPVLKPHGNGWGYIDPAFFARARNLVEGWKMSLMPLTPLQRSTNTCKRLVALLQAMAYRPKVNHA